MPKNIERTMYIVPPGPGDLGGKVFERGSFLGGDFADFFRAKGINVKTIDAWSLAAHRKEDVLVVFNHADDYFLFRILYFFKYFGKKQKRFPVSRKDFFRILAVFSKKILFQGEPPIIQPYPYRNLDRMLELYDRIALKVDLKRRDVGYFVLPYDVSGDMDILERSKKYSAISKTKFLTIINSNCRPHGFFKHELYSERLRAIKHFSNSPDFDLYGTRWNHWPYFHWSYAKYVKKAWRGWIPEKLPVLSQYKFTLCFENSAFSGYVDTKFGDCYVAGSIPIYLGAPDILDYVPEDAFIDMRKFKNYAELEKYLRSFSDKDIERYRVAMKNFLLSEKYKVFSRKRFNETVWSYIQ